MITALNEDAFSSEIDNFYNAGCNDAGLGQPPMVGDMDYEEKVAYMKGYNARKQMKLNINEARTIGPIKIRTIKKIVADNPTMDNEEILTQIPADWFDVWEGAYTEIQRVINDEKTKIMYGESYQKENRNSNVIDAFLADTFPKQNKNRIWGTQHLKIQYSPDGQGWGVVNYQTYLLFRSDVTGRLYFNIEKYSRTTSKIQSYISYKIIRDAIKIKGDEMDDIVHGYEKDGDREEEESYKRNESQSKENTMKYTLVEEKRTVNEMVSPTNISSNLDDRIDTFDRLSVSDIRLPENPTDEDRFMVQAQKTFKQRYGRKPDMKKKEERDEVERYFSRLTPNYRKDTQEKNGLQTFDDEKKVYKLVDSQTKTEKESVEKPQYRLVTEAIIDDDDPRFERTEFEDGVSDCCGAQIKWGDICCDCGEHCEAVYDDDVVEDTIENIDSNKEEPETNFFGNEADDYETDEFSKDAGFADLDNSSNIYSGDHEFRDDTELDTAEYRGNDYGLDESTEPKEFVLVEEINTKPEAEVITEEAPVSTEPTKSYTITKLEDNHAITEANLFSYLENPGLWENTKVWKEFGRWFTDEKNTKDINKGIHILLNGNPDAQDEKLKTGLKQKFLAPTLKKLYNILTDKGIEQICDSLEAILIKKFSGSYRKANAEENFVGTLKQAIKDKATEKGVENSAPAQKKPETVSAKPEIVVEK